jgi:hypothetical protein
MGFGFSTPDFPNFVQTLYEQAQLQYNLISFGIDLNDRPLPPGTTSSFAVVGNIRQDMVLTPFVNYSVDIPNGNWSFTLYNVAIDNLRLGYNGFVSVDFNSPFSVVPTPFIETFFAFVNVTASVFGFGELTVYQFDCNANQWPDPNIWPNITYSMAGGVPFVMTPFQYVFKDPNNDTSCTLGFADSGTVDPADRAWTLGVNAFNGTYVAFDFPDKVMMVAEYNITVLPFPPGP